MANRHTWQILFWIIAGGLIGVGLLGFDVLFISAPCLLVGISLCFFGVRHWGTSDLWVACLSLGGIPTLFLLRDFITAYPPCPPQGLTIPAGAPAGTSVSCGVIPVTYNILLACFGIITIVSGAWPILRRFTHR